MAGAQMDKMQNNKSRSTAVRERLRFRCGRKKGFRRAEGVCWVYMHLAGADNAHSILLAIKEQASPDVRLF